MSHINVLVTFEIKGLWMTKETMINSSYTHRHIQHCAKPDISELPLRQTSGELRKYSSLI